MASSSRFFRMVAVWVPSADIVEAMKEEIRLTRRLLGLAERYEFKFSKTWSYPDRREAFFKAAMKYDFRFAYSAIDKNVADWRSSSKQAFHWATSTELAATLRPNYMLQIEANLKRTGRKPAKELILVDDNRDKQFLAMIEESFQSLGMMCEPRLHPIGKVKFANSKSSDLMQLADMICGAAGENQEGVNDLYKLIMEREVIHRKQKKPG
jgi:hypothetical protein